MLPSLTCQVRAVCGQCGEDLLPGEATRPINSFHSADARDTDGNPPRRTKAPPVVWCHVQCVAHDDPRVPECKHFSRVGYCMYENKCAFRHISPAVIEKCRARYGTFQRRRIYNEGKCSALRRWLLSVFGEEYLKSGSGIIDVAGGKGELAFELSNLNDIQVTVIDPRPLRLHRYTRKLQFGYYHRNAALAKYNSQSRRDDPRIPRHIRGFFESSLDDSDACADDGFKMPKILASEEVYCVEINRAKGISWTSKGLVHEDEDGEEEESICEDKADILDVDASAAAGGEIAGDEVHDVGVARELLRGASLMLGLHPDQATDHIADLCLANKVPFAIVPCCVYGRQFPHRRHPLSGSPVCDYADLVEYLLAKSPEIKAVELDFEGKNVLLYYMAHRVPLNSPSEAKPHICKGEASSIHWKALARNIKDETCSTAVSSKANRRVTTGAAVHVERTYEPRMGFRTPALALDDFAENCLFSTQIFDVNH